jgi:alpha-N-arabinofuranosidase
MNASVTTLVRYHPSKDGGEAGLVAIQNDDFWYFLGIGRENGRMAVSLKRRAGPTTGAGGEMIASAPVDLAAGAPLFLKIEARGGRYDFHYATRENAWKLLRGGEDGTILSTRTAGGFVGALFGLHARSGTQKMER